MQVCLDGRRRQWMREAAVTIGNFDGVHLGHRHILQRLRQEADDRGLRTAVVVFEPQPQEFFARAQGRALPYRLSPLRDKLALMADSGCVDAVWVLRFNRSFAALGAETFVRQVLQDGLRTRYLLVGDDFRFGAGRCGDFDLLRQQADFETAATPSVLVADERASSTAVRRALAAGDLPQAAAVLGRDYALSGRVKHGVKLGRTLGFPTANIHLPPHHYALSGVFVVRVDDDRGHRWRGVANFGSNPTVTLGGLQRLEVHLFDCRQDLYGRRLRVSFLHKLREERRFDSLAALQAQIGADAAAARSWQAA